MKKLIAGMLCLLFAGCGSGQASKEKVLRKALRDTNIALTEAQDRAVARQAQAERLARKLYRQRDSKKGK